MDQENNVKAERVERGLAWLKKMFSEENLQPTIKANKPATIVNYAKLLRTGADAEDPILMLNRYVANQLHQKNFAFAFDDPQAPDSMVILHEKLEIPGVVDALANLSYELLEHKTSPETYKAQHKTQDTTGPDINSDFVINLHEIMPDLPEASPHFPKVASVVSAKVALAVLEDVTGGKWIERNDRGFKYYCSVPSFQDADTLSALLRTALNKMDDGFPALSPNADKVAIPANYINGSNLGLLIESKNELRPAFLEKCRTNGDLPSMG